MNVEHIKSGLLIVLIGLSIILTWQLYTYQPEIALLDDVTSRYVSSELIGEERVISDVIQPDQMVVHYNDMKALIPKNNPKFSRLYEKLITASFEDIEVSDDIFPKVNERGGIELLFPTSVPSHLFLNMISVETDYLYPGTVIDRIYLYVNDANGQVYMQFLSSEDRRVGSMKTNIAVNEFEEVFVQPISEYIPVKTLAGERPTKALITEDVYITTEPFKVDKLSYGATKLSVHLFRQSLFTDPNAVKYYQQTDGEDSYTDGNRIINLRKDGLFMEYGNTIFLGSQELTKHIVQGGYEFINGHGGWTDQYLLSNWVSTTSRDEVEFRLELNGFPVHSIDGQDRMTLKAKRSGNQIISYSRPLLDLDSLPINASQKIEMPAGEEVISYLQNDELFDVQRISRVSVGYEMHMTNPTFFTVEPHWYVLYGSRWQKVALDQLEGAGDNGLE